MRFPVILTIAALLAPAGIAATSVRATGISAPTANEFSAAKKKKKTTVKKSTDENLKAAPGTGPSGPSTKY